LPVLQLRAEVPEDWIGWHMLELSITVPSRVVEMGLDLSKGSGRNGSSGESSRHSETPSGDPIAQFRHAMALRLSGDYLESSERESLLTDATSYGVGRTESEVALDLELERLGIANEHALLLNLEAVLQRFTAKDKKLDPKERTDALQMACRPGPGFRQGLRYDVADRFAIEFCRNRGVKVKTGMFSWAIP
jgi:hypothetical protein